MGGSVNPQGYFDIINNGKCKTASLGQEVEKQARECPQHSAILWQEKVISYEEYNRRANRYANFFHSQGYKKGDVVALLMDNCPEYLMVVTGLAKIGVITALINTGVRGEVLAQGINLAEARSMIIGSNFIELYQTIAERLRFRSPGTVYVDGVKPALELPASLHSLTLGLEDCSEENLPLTSEIKGEDILVYLYTSGSSGARKAVPVSHQRWWMVGQQMKSFGNLDGDSIQYMCLPLYYNSGFTVCFSGMIISGSTMVLKSEFSATRFWSDIRRYQANYFTGVGEMCRYLYSQEERPDDADNSLEIVICNGMWGDLIEPFKQRFGIKHMIEIYGTTENVGSFFNYEEIPGMCGNLSILNQRQGEVVCCDFDSSELLRDENKRLIRCNPGMVGALLCEINDVNPFYGYVNDLEATEAKIIRNGFQEGDVYLNTCDLMELHEDDYISFVDRLGDTYRWKAKTVSAHQVADVLIKFFGAIEDASVYGVKIPGYEGRCGMAALTFIEGETMDWKRFLSYINRRMPEHARPIFVRICKQMDHIDSLEEVKRQLQQESFDISRVRDPIFLWHPQKEAYIPMTQDIYNDIMTGKLSF
ncbi:MAG: AMP-binding protein [Syntrophomonadaceae bacterium]|nr:AMP-binding protein [Syntrophomonadaceae bacterium]